MSSAGAITASTFAGQQLPDARASRAVLCRQGHARRRTTCTAASDRLVDIFTLAAKVAGPSTSPPTPAVPPPSAPAFTAPSVSLPSVTPSEAQAAVDSAVSGAIDFIKAGGNLAKNGVDAAATGLGYAKDAFDRVSPVVSDAANTAAPYVKSAAKTAGQVAAPAVDALKPVVQNALGQAETFLYSKGLNSQAIVSTAKDVQGKASGAIDAASPTVNSSIRTLSRYSATELAELALGLVVLYYLGPPFLRLVFGGLRGYRGEISPATALDTAVKEGNCAIVDIRSDRDKENNGVPDLPFGGRLIECEYASVSDRKLRGQLKNVSEIERQVTTLEIASLKRIGKGTKILLLDNNGNVSKRIARELGRRGFRNVFVISGGFNGWTSQKLQTKLSNVVSTPQILGPIFGTQSSPGTSRRALPSGRY